MTDERSWQTQDGQDGEPDPETQRIVSEIEGTRQEMGTTINQIGHRLQPQTIADEAREKIREATVGRVERIVDDAGQTAQRTGTTVIDTIRENPVPTAMAAMGIGWLIVRMRDSAGRRGSEQWRYASYSGYPYGQGQDNGGSGAMERARGVADQATGTAHEVADQATQRAQQVGADVQQAAQSAVSSAQDTVQQAQYQFDRTLSQSPLAVAALAVGVGAAVGLALPETQKERELYHEPRERLMEKVSEATNQALGEAENKAQELGEQMRSEG